VDGSLEQLVQQALPATAHRLDVDPLLHGGLYVAADAITNGTLSWECHYVRGTDHPRFIRALRRYGIRELVPAVVTVAASALPTR
jgi:hypothetical protein